MKLRIFILIVLIILALSTTLQADEKIGLLMDKFYNGLADIIERNMNNPNKCLIEVDNYYMKNRSTVEKVRKWAEKPMAESMAMLEEYKNMNEAELRELEKKQNQLQAKNPQASEGAVRYANAIQAFTMKYPEAGIEISMKATEFMPRGGPAQWR